MYIKNNDIYYHSPMNGTKHVSENQKISLATDFYFTERTQP